MLVRDYQTRKELLVFVYYLMEFAESSLFNEIIAESTISNDTQKTPLLLQTVEDVICVYQQNDPYTVQVALSILNLLFSPALL